MEERAFYTESETTKPARLTCPFCREETEVPLRWLVRTQKDRLPGGTFDPSYGEVVELKEDNYYFKLGAH